MGISEDIRDAKKRPSKRPKPQAGDNVRPFTFHPTAEQGEFLRGKPFDLHETMEGLEGVLQRGHRITIGYTDKGESLYVVIRQGGEDWSKTKAVFVYHNDLEKALTGLWFYLMSVEPGWPDTSASTGLQERFW